MSTSRRSARPAWHRFSDPARPSPRLPTTFGQTPDRATRVGETPTPEPADDRAARLTKAAVDPSSPITGGALLGDRVRMQAYAGDDGVFIRSMAARGHAGGLASSTGAAAAVLDAAGFDMVLVE